MPHTHHAWLLCVSLCCYGTSTVADVQNFTAEDLVFNWEYAADPATSAITTTTYRDIERVDKLDSHTVKLVFKNPTPFWFDAFCGARGMMIPKHLFDGYRGANLRHREEARAASQRLATRISQQRRLA